MPRSLRSAYNVLLSALIIVTIGACTTLTESRSELRTTFSAGPVERVTDPATVAPYTTRLVVRPGGVDVLGRFSLPTPCWRLSTEVVREGAIVTLVVMADAEPATGGVCIQVLALREYTAAVRGVPPGRYTVRVVHAMRHMSDLGELMLEQQVEIH